MLCWKPADERIDDQAADRGQTAGATMSRPTAAVSWARSQALTCDPHALCG